MLDELINRPCVIMRRTSTGSVDGHGNATTTTTSTTTVCELQQNDHTEPAGEGVIAVGVWTLILKAGEVIGPDDRVVVGGLVYEVRGEPWDARDPETGEVDHIEATLVITDGGRETGS